MKHFFKKPYFVPALVLGVLFLGSLIMQIGFAWTNPTSNPPTSTNTINISGGNVGIGTGSPASKLHVKSAGSTMMTVESGGVGTYSQIEFNRGVAGDTWVGVASDNTLDIWTTENIPILFGTNSGERMRINGNGNVGIGTTNPGVKLDVAGDVRLTGDLSYGNSDTRTQTKSDAGAMGGKSGFYETSAPVNYPAGASSWWHLIEARHSNVGNNYAMQFAGSFFDQQLWFRKTNNSATTAWQRVLTTADAINATYAP